MRALCLGQRLEPVGDFVETLFTGGFRHAGIHVGVFMRFTGNRGLQVIRGATDGQSGGRVTNLLQVLQMTVRMTGLAFRGGTKHGGNVIVAFDIGL